MNRLGKDELFRSGFLTQGLARKSVRGGMTTMGSQGVQVVLRIVGTVILARMLTPADYGLIGMVMVVIGFAEMFKDAGLSFATIQREEISHEQISTLFWINILFSGFLGLCILAGSPLVALFYGKPELTAVTAALSFSFVIGGLTIQHQALLRRHMQFGILAAIQIAAQVIILGVAVSLALAGWRYWALVGGTLAGAVTEMLLTYVFCPWIPGRMKRGTGVLEMLKFGGNLTGFNFLNYFARNADSILIGRFCGAVSLGLYSKAYQFMVFPIMQINSPVSAVAMPVLSRLQNDPDRYRGFYCRAVSIIGFITMPLVVFLMTMSGDIVMLLLGAQWMGVVPIFSLLGLAALVQPITSANGWLFITQGRTREMFYWGIFSSTTTVLSFVIGLPWGPEGVALGYALGCLIRAPLAFWYVCRKGPVRMDDILRAAALPLFASGTVFAVLALAQYAYGSAGSVARLSMAFPLAVLTVLISYIPFPAGRSMLTELKDNLLLFVAPAGKT